MSPEHLNATARRVVSGIDSQGRSTIVIDEVTRTRVALPAFTCNDVWRAENVPTTFEVDELGEDLEFSPPASGITVRLVTFPPDSEIDRSAYQETIDRFHGPDLNTNHETVVGMHAMDTVDIDTVISGEIYCIFETGEETLLKQGDTIINRGVTHAWSNRTDKPATVVATVVSSKG